MRPSQKGWAAFFPAIARASWFVGVPPIFNAMIQFLSQAMKGIDTSKVRFWASVASALPPHVAEGLHREFGIDLYNMYAASEGQQLFNSPSSVPDPALRCTTFNAVGFPGSPWPAEPGIHLKLIDEHGSDVSATGGPGVLWMKTPTLFTCYSSPEANATLSKVFDSSGYFCTSDLFQVVRDAQGAPRWLQFLGRATDQVKLRTHMYSLLNIEAIAMEMEPLKEVAAACLPILGSGADNEIWFLVVPASKDAPTPTAEAIGEFLRHDQRLPPCCHPVGVVTVKSLPLTKAYKLDRSKVTEIALQARG